MKESQDFVFDILWQRQGEYCKVYTSGFDSKDAALTALEIAKKENPIYGIKWGIRTREASSKYWMENSCKKL